MKKHAVNSAIVATLGVALALMCTSAIAGKPGGGGSTDPCAAPGIDFPAFSYWKASGKTLQIFVADSTAKCSRAVTTVTTAVSPVFSYPVDNTTDRGRVVWREGTVIYAVDLRVLSGNVISASAKVALYSPVGCCALDLSQDGRTVYFSYTDTSLATFDLSTHAVNQLYALPATDQSWFFMTATVSGSQRQLFVTKYGNQANSGASQLARIDLATDTTLATEAVLRTWAPHLGYGANVFAPAVNQDDDRVAFLEYIEGTNNCTQLVVTDMYGKQLFPAANVPRRFGTSPTWFGNNVLLERRSPMDGSGKCANTGSISQVEIATNAETVLTSGYVPNGR
jgi:hypothetical protein